MKAIRNEWITGAVKVPRWKHRTFVSKAAETKVAIVKELMAVIRAIDEESWKFYRAAFEIASDNQDRKKPLESPGKKQT